MASLQAAAQTYRINQVTNASPLDLVLMAYDAALIGCAQRDLARTTEAISVLRNALDFRYDHNIAMGLFRLYQYSAELARKGDYDQAAHLLRELRDTWAQVKGKIEAEIRAAQSSSVGMPAAVPGGAYAAANRAPVQRSAGAAMSSVTAVA
jgi:flagellin-specific chaperone FliS